MTDTPVPAGSPAESLIQQIAVLSGAAMVLQQAIVCAAAKLALAGRAPDWRDVGDLAQLVDQVKRADLAS